MNLERDEGVYFQTKKEKKAKSEQNLYKYR